MRSSRSAKKRRGRRSPARRTDQRGPASLGRATAYRLAMLAALHARRQGQTPGRSARRCGRTFAPRAAAVMIARDDPPARPPGRAHPRPGRGDGDLPPGPRPRPGGLRRRGLRGLQRAPRPHPTRRRARDARGLPRRGRRHRRDNTFGGTRIPLAEYGLAHKVRQINATAARLARAACAKFETPERPRFVAGSMGPGTKTISVTGGITFDEVAAAFAEQTVGLVEGGTDILFLETQQDTLNVKAALLGIDRGFADAGRVLPVVLSVSIESMGTMLAGQSIEAAYVSVAHR